MEKTLNFFPSHDPLAGSRNHTDVDKGDEGERKKKGKKKTHTKKRPEFEEASPARKSCNLDIAILTRNDQY